MTLEAHQSTPTSHEDRIRRTLFNKTVGLRFKNIALFASAVTSPKVPVGMATTTTTNPADEVTDIRFQRIY